MPEGPEVERVRRSLEPWLVGARVEGVTLRRRDVVTTPHDPPGGAFRQRPPQNWSVASPRPVPRSDLLLNDTIEELTRHGKQLAILGASGRALVVHLGMTGRLLVAGPDAAPTAFPHTHIVWRLRLNAAPVRLRFVDPRRFGGVWTIATREELATRLQSLGPDATRITDADLIHSNRASRRPIKAALLDQGVVAGVGNIYADESLFAAGIDPRRRADSLTPAEWRRLAGAIRSTIASAIDAGGSTIRDYADANGVAGRAQRLHAVYGRGGQACFGCDGALAQAIVAQRTTVWCPNCQPSTPAPARAIGSAP